jgi:hypothetical protein
MREPTGLAGARELQSNHGAFEACAGNLKVFFSATESAQSLFCMLACHSCASSVYFLRVFGYLCEDGDPVGINFNETSRNVQTMGDAILDVRENPRLKLRDERCMAGQDSQLAIQAWNVDRIDRFREDAPLRCDDF